MKTYHIYSKGKFEYILEVDVTTDNSTRYILKRSSIPDWMNPFEVLLSIIDNGSGLNFGKEIGPNINYAEAEYLVLLLHLISLLEKEKEKFLIIGEEDQYKIEI